MTQTKFAGDTRTVADPATGVQRQVIEGTAIPPDLLVAYEQAGGTTIDREPGRTGEVIAAETVTVHDTALGFDREVIAGQQVPPDLVKAYNAKVAGAPPAADVSKPAAAPKSSARTKAPRA